VKLTSKPELGPLVLSHTGFTNFYKAFRKSSQGWMDELPPLFRQAFELENNEDGLRLVAVIERLPGRPKANQTGQLITRVHVDANV
jgi:hypothetical protein